MSDYFNALLSTTDNPYIEADLVEVAKSYNDPVFIFN